MKHLFILRKSDICFSKAKRPIKIEDYTFTEDKDKLVVNDKSQVTAPQQCQYDFQYREITTPQSPRVSIFDVLNQQKEWAIVTVVAKGIKKSETKTVGKNNLKLCEVVVADESAFIPLDVWEDHISTVEQGKLYTLQSVQLRIWAGKKKLVTTQRTTITKQPDNPEMAVAPAVLEQDEEEEVVTATIKEFENIKTFEKFQKNAKMPKESFTRSQHQNSHMSKVRNNKDYQLWFRNISIYRD